MVKAIVIAVLLLGVGWYVVRTPTSVNISPVTDAWDRVVTPVLPKDASTIKSSATDLADGTTKNISQYAEATKKEAQAWFDESVHTVRTQVYDKAASGAQEALESLRGTLGLDTDSKDIPKTANPVASGNTNDPVIIFENPNQQTQSVAPMTTIQDQQQVPVSVCAVSKKEELVKFGIKVSAVSSQDKFMGRVEWGDGSQSQTLLVRSDSATLFEHRYALDGTFTIGIIIEDGKTQYRSYKLACIE